jgi:hypothetical protein
MKKFAGITIGLTLAILAFFLMSADHIDAPSVAGGSADITDYYAFQSPGNSDNMVFTASLQGLLSPAATGDAVFDESVLLEFNIDNDGDLIEDLVIQAVVRDGAVYAFGPTVPTRTGATSTINSDAPSVSADVTPYGTAAITGTDNGMSVFAGPRDDPFFFDLGAYQAILGGMAPGFNDPGTDTFAGTNVMSIVIEVPKSSLGNAATINTWAVTKVRQ